MSTYPPSMLIGWLADSCQSSARDGATAGPDTLMQMGRLLRLIEASVRQNEDRLNGIRQFGEGSNVISLEPYLSRRDNPGGGAS